jgi:hypothetical protein
LQHCKPDPLPGLPLAEIARQFGVSTSAISKIFTSPPEVIQLSQERPLRPLNNFSLDRGNIGCPATVVKTCKNLTGQC